MAGSYHILNRFVNALSVLNKFVDISPLRQCGAETPDDFAFQTDESGVASVASEGCVSTPSN